MEQWEVEHIEKNLVELIQNTTCSTILLSRLRSAEVLGKNDEEDLVQLRTPSEKSKSLYGILLTRRGAFNVLLKALEETRQTGALKILRDRKPHYQNHGLISIDKNRLLGKGSFGTKVYRGTFDGREVAVKVLLSDMIESETALKEVDLIKKLDEHENVVRYFYVEIKESLIYIALELCLIDLQEEVKMKLINLPPTEILRKCATGLAFLHEHNIIHRDLKPANILLNRLKQVKISDFGLSKEIPHGESSVSVSGVVGTTDWMAPEILKILMQESRHQERVTMAFSSDVFSLGCIFYFALTYGSHPFGSPGDRVHYILKDFSTILNVEDEWAALIKTMISHNAKGRPSVNEILSNKIFQVQTLLSQGESCAIKTEPKSSSKTLQIASPSIVPEPGSSKFNELTDVDKAENVACPLESAEPSNPSKVNDSEHFTEIKMEDQISQNTEQFPSKPKFSAICQREYVRAVKDVNEQHTRLKKLLKKF